MKYVINQQSTDNKNSYSYDPVPRVSRAGPGHLGALSRVSFGALLHDRSAHKTKNSA